MIDLRKFTLRLKVIELLDNFTKQRMMKEAHAHWRSWIHPN